MSFEFDGMAFASAEERAYIINADPTDRRKWRDQHATPMGPPVRGDIIIESVTPRAVALPIGAQQLQSHAEPPVEIPLKISEMAEAQREETLTAMQGAELSCLINDEL